ncbi:MAG: hypothetical protein Q9208_002565 [Pyrenodesmia sp. 3 TL-2023]
MAKDQHKHPEEWLGISSDDGSPFMEMPLYKRQHIAIREARKQRVLEKLMTPSLLLSRRRKTSARKSRKRHHFDYFSKLPTELILAIMKKSKQRDLKNLVRANQRTRSIAKWNQTTIHIGIQEEQFPEYHQLFGTFDRMTPEQEYAAMVEEENREWWKKKDDEQLIGIRGSTGDMQHLPGHHGRTALYSALAKDLAIARIELCNEEGLPRLGDKKLTEKALMLFWKMQWNDRPGLEHLCERSETEDHYLDIRHKLFVNEKPEVRSRFIEILTFVGSRFWRESQLWHWILTWVTENLGHIRSQQHTSVEALECWGRNLAADLTVEAVSKIGIRRALRMDHPDVCDIDLDWILNTMIDRLEELLIEGTHVLSTHTPTHDFRFGQAIGLRAEEIVG